MKKDYVVSIFLFSQFDGEYHLLLLNHKKLNRWLTPGGHIEFGEDPLEAARREVYEETNLQEIEFLTFVHTDHRSYSDASFILPPEYMFEEIIQPHKEEPLHKHIDLIYIAKTSDRKIALNADESNNIGWFTESQLKELNLFEMTMSLAKSLFPMVKGI